MARPKARPQTLKHLPFFQLLAEAPEGSPEACVATAGLLALRMMDHWVLVGPPIVEPESVSVRSVRHAIMALPAQEPVREALLTIVNTMQMLHHVDMGPVLPRVFAYGQLLERHHGAMALAADVYASIIRLSDAGFDSELVMDSYYRMAFCQRKLGAFEDALDSSEALTKLATRRRDRTRILRGRMGTAQVAMMRGEHASADSQFLLIAKEAKRRELMREYAMAIHNRAVVAARAGNPTDAIELAHEALQNTSDPFERDRVLADLAAFLLWSGRTETALDALRILELTAASEEPRQSARANIVIAAARIGNRELFDAARRELSASSLSPEARLNLYIESARGLRAFGAEDEAESSLRDAEALARMAGNEHAWAVIAEVRSASPVAATPPREGKDDVSLRVAATLRTLAPTTIG